MIRLQKYLAACGVASRRACEQLIADGVVTVDGEIVAEQGVRIDPATQRVTCHGQPVTQDPPVWIALNKPPGVICTSDDPQGRERALDLIPGLPQRVYTVGRLDVMSEGLILVTNDGELAHRLMHPRHHIEKKYQVWTDQPLRPGDREKMLRGVNSRGELLRALHVEPLQRTPDGRQGFTITLGEGRNRHIRRMMEVLGYRIERLIRVSIGPLRLEKLRSGESRPLGQREIEQLRLAVGLDKDLTMSEPK